MRRRVKLRGSLWTLCASATTAWANTHVVVFGKWIAVQWNAGPGANDKLLRLKVRALIGDGQAKEYMLGALHEVAEPPVRGASCLSRERSPARGLRRALAVATWWMASRRPRFRTRHRDQTDRVRRGVVGSKLVSRLWPIVESVMRGKKTYASGPIDPEKTGRYPVVCPVGLCPGRSGCDRDASTSRRGSL